MKEPRIFVRMDPEEKAQAMAVAAARGQTLSECIRASLSRMVKRAEKKQGDAA